MQLIGRGAVARHVSQLRQEALKASNRCDRRMQRAKLQSNPPGKYSVGEKVFVRLLGKVQKKCHVIEAQIEKRNLKTQTYRVAFTSLVTGKREKKRLPVGDITSLTLREEIRKQKAAKLSKRQLISNES